MRDIPADHADAAPVEPGLGEIAEQWWAGIKSRLALFLELFGTEATLAVRSVAIALFSSVLAALLMLVAWCVTAGALAFAAVSAGVHWIVVLATLALLHIVAALALLTFSYRLMAGVGFSHSRAALQRKDPEELDDAV